MQSNSCVQKYLVTPLREFLVTVTKPRPGRLRAYIYTLLTVYTLYWMALPYTETTYLYMLKVRNYE